MKQHKPIDKGDRVRPCLNSTRPAIHARDGSVRVPGEAATLHPRSFVVGCRHRPAGRLMLDLIDPATGEELHGVTAWIRVRAKKEGRDRHFIAQRDAEIARRWDMTHS